MLIVLVIIGVLATIAIPQYNKMVDKARWTQAAETMGQIFRAQLCFNELGSIWRSFAQVIKELPGTITGLKEHNKQIEAIQAIGN